MKISILGRGNAGCITALHFHHYSKLFNLNIELELIYDSKIEPVPVGQATTLELARFLWQSTDLNKLEKFSFTKKTGIMYENWGKKNKKWFHDFPFGTYAIHFDPKTFQDFIINNLNINFKETDENIINYDKIDSDYIIDCRGAPLNLDNYDQLINPLNCALLASLPKDESLVWTRTVASPDGWCFHIPLEERISVGYLFNKEITKEEEAKKNLKEIFNIEKVNKVFNFNQYIAKKPIINNRVFLNGNKLFFLEPLEATAMATYSIWCRDIWDYIFNNKFNLLQLEEKIKKYVKNTQDFILWHYNFGSQYDTIFWKFAKNMYQKNMCSNFENKIKQIDLYSLPYLKNNPYLYEFSLWNGWNFKNWLEGMNKNYE